MSLTPETVLVLGANRGIGLAFVQELVKLTPPPRLVLATYRDPDSAKELTQLAAGNDAVKLLKVDVEKDEMIEEAAEEAKSLLGDRGLNLLVCNSGMHNAAGPEPDHVLPDRADVGDMEYIHHLSIKMVGGKLQAQTREGMQKHFNVNTIGPLMVVQKFLPLLRQAASRDTSKPMSCSRAAVAFISSLGGSVQLSHQIKAGFMMQYKMSKTALNMAAVLLAHEVKDDGILVTSLHPGWVKTRMGTDLGDLTPEQSVSHMLTAMSKLDQESTGKFLNFDGTPLSF